MRINAAQYVAIHQAPTVATRRLLRSVYSKQVQRIAPPQLLGREAELAELARFCAQEGRGPYVWWRAGPWAGKSALLSTFVLHPSTELVGRVQLVSFFITARLAAQDTRDAFVTALTEQLCAITGQDLPVGLTEANREAAMLDLLDQAAAACRRANRRLILVVDGLDEDRGVTTGRHAHSIAGLLPARPPAGMRIIVAGRPNPPIPDDVPDWHPLRDPGIIRLLGDSPHARDLQRLSGIELQRLLSGDQVERDLLGLLTAARGGLSGPDLCELTGADLVHIEQVLHTAAGRAFMRRPGTWTSGRGSDVYLLGHEELHHAATHYLGTTQLTEYRNRIHAWADSYRTPTANRPAWPDTTPEYLLAGYPHMLAAAGDITQLTAVALDPARHDCMLDRSGGDAAALTEITLCQDLHLAQAEIDLYALAQLSRHRGELEDRNESIPTNLPAVWALLGQPIRAEALARGMSDPGQQAVALAEVAEAATQAGEHQRAHRLASDAEHAARAITIPYMQALTLAGLVRAAAHAGEFDRAQQLAHAITNQDQQAPALADVAAHAGEFDAAEQITRTMIAEEQAWALVEVAKAAARAGEFDRAEQIASAITNPDQQVCALADVAACAGEFDRAEQIASAITNLGRRAPALAEMAEMAAQAGQHQRAHRLASDADRLARAITRLDQQAWALAQVAARVGEFDRAEQIARAITDPDQQGLALAEVAEAAARAGEFDRAEQLAYALTGPNRQARTLAEVAGLAARAGEHQRAHRLASDAERIARAAGGLARQEWTSEMAWAATQVGEFARAEQFARATAEPTKRAWALAEVAEAAAGAGEFDRAEQIARTITIPERQSWALAAVAKAVAASGEFDQAEQIARTITDPFGGARALAEVAGAVARLRELERAERVARSITDVLDQQVQALAAAAEAAAHAGEHQRARRLANDAELVARAVTHPYKRVKASAAVIRAVARASQFDWAEQLACAIADPDRQVRALTEVGEAAARAGDHERARRLLSDAEQLAGAMTDPALRPQALASVVRAAAHAGEFDWAEQVARALTTPDRRVRVLTEVAGVAAQAGEHRRARRLAFDAEQVARTITTPGEQARALTSVAMVVDQTKVSRLLGEAYAMGSWLYPLSALVHLDPQLVKRIVHEMHEGECPHGADRARPFTTK